MFKKGFFKYAGVYSGKYNLIMAYVNRNQDFIAGATYEPMTDSLPSRAEDILYGIKYAENPLEFEVDIIKPDGNIPMEQMQEIHEWLFGQDGWKKLFIKAPDYENIYLKCLLIPENIIKDVGGFVGFRCKIRNISGFWYGKDKVITYTKEQINALCNNGADLIDGKYVNLSLDIETQCNEKIYPIVKFYAADEDFGNATHFSINVHNNKTDYESDLYCIIDRGGSDKIVSMDCKWGDYVIEGKQSQLISLNTDYDLFYLEKGVNNVYLGINENNDYKPPSYISFIYTPMLRVGGF